MLVGLGVKCLSFCPILANKGRYIQIWVKFSNMNLGKSDRWKLLWYMWTGKGTRCSLKPFFAIVLWTRITNPLKIQLQKFSSYLNRENSMLPLEVPTLHGEKSCGGNNNENKHSVWETHKMFLLNQAIRVVTTGLWRFNKPYGEDQSNFVYVL
jgi:hypothetical protein